MRVFLSSPADVVKERERFPIILEKVNKRNAESKYILLRPSMWEDVSRGPGRPQERINKDKLEDSHLFVGILWKRWGSPTGLKGYTSGFEEEYETAKALNKPTKLYFRAIPESCVKNPDDQLKKVLEFKEKAKKEGIIGEYRNEAEWEEKLHDDLSKWVNEQFLTDRAEEQGKVPVRSQLAPLEILFEKNVNPYYHVTEGTRYAIFTHSNLRTYFAPADTTLERPVVYRESRKIKMPYRLVKVKNVAHVTARKCKVRITVSRDEEFSSPLVNNERAYYQWDTENARQGNEPVPFDLNPGEDQAITICHTEEDRPGYVFFDDYGKISNSRLLNLFGNGTYYLKVRAYCEDRAPSEADFKITKGEGYDSLEMERI